MKTTIAFAVKDKSGGAEKSTCKHCGCYGHEEVSYFEIINYLPKQGTWDHGHGGQGIRSARGDRAARGRESGPTHKAAYAAAAQAEAAVSHEGPAAQVSWVSIPGFEIGIEAFKLIDVPKARYEKLSGKLAWLIDSEASCHLICDLRLINEIKNI